MYNKIKSDERELMCYMLANMKKGIWADFRELASKLNIDERRARYISEKWQTKGWADSGVSDMACWINESQVKHIMVSLHITEESLRGR